MALWLLIRPRTLWLTLGVVLAAAMGAFAWPPFALSLLTVLLLQILSNIANDYGDALCGTDANRSQNAPTRAGASGQLSATAVRRWLVATALAVAVSGVALLRVCLHGWRDWLVFLLLGALAIATALAYTLGRRPYGYRALGEVAVFLSFGLLGVCGNVYLQTHTLPAAVLLPAAGSGLLTANVLQHINNIRDLSSDWAAGKHTLANKIGFSGSLKMHRALLLAGLACYALYAVAAWQSLLWLLALPMMVRHARRVSAARSEAESGAELGAAVMLHFALNALFAIGVLLT
ncbi:1,4-dihydroxy-2-naphthoate octaprenyltransferase [Kingella sp. (in: b-proteobacteria)]|uniref:1,4-dihydroxy-2-naphthoate octaprenyltransferase n=1 Tax=Kingella sp. (in: b-proteobacteria) TaxID=2020713 RepID=UPI0026DCBD52|nr:1,4-dihydroxy-2-naphthoate octaprenyltransferase [Kingella sp. (in: b-proteobacteria)]MDO4656375.1 1,4-dihydroxy-2-naphthoate octaprenyltransferase [Kingella sp. (in: b-proteobacteria)]